LGIKLPKRLTDSAPEVGGLKLEEVKELEKALTGTVWVW